MSVKPAKLLSGLRARMRGMVLLNTILACAVLVAAFVAYLLVSGGGTSAASTTTTTVQRGTVLQTVSASGNLQPVNEVDLSFSTSGTVTAQRSHSSRPPRPASPAPRRT
ncbi:MAG: hypothetical protein ABSB99_11750 [Acidimicrobiales bacterium]